MKAAPQEKSSRMRYAESDPRCQPAAHPWAAGFLNLSMTNPGQRSDVEIKFQNMLAYAYIFQLIRKKKSQIYYP